MQSNTHHGAKLQNQDANLQKSGCNSKYPYSLESSTLKLHKYTLKLYNYAVLEYWISMENGELAVGGYAKLKPKKIGIAS